MSAVELEVTELPLERCCELAAWRTGAGEPAGAAWQLAPGAVRSTADGAAELLHFAPGRWLVPEPSVDLLTRLAAHPAATLVDVEGKWRRLRLRGAAATRTLAASIPVESILAGRDCAAVTLFDCPAILRRISGDYEIWVLASYQAALRARFEDPRLSPRASSI